MSEPSLPDKVLALHQGLSAAKVGHAFGGALALAYYAEPRATIDIDLNVFVPPSAHATVAQALVPLGVTAIDTVVAERDGQCRSWWGRTPIDLFFAYDELHEAMRRQARLVPFGEDRIPVLSPEHLVICKSVFDRPKDWLDIEQVLVSTQDLDTQEIGNALDRLLGSKDHRRRRFDAAVRALLGQGS
ncbi:MAG TPA: nucleotidyl transferase AbiEii/AbiGii toxin family protein [Solirubrobacteraceae bacterium]|nr:nucleotidyl transferase AbiEii/AbiGii toxin family protein [Solirubrobacteraceae bacterium]